jgi:glutathione S-transferase
MPTDLPDLILISHPLCPYVQRAAIALAEKKLPFQRRDIDLAAKPGWFLAVSPLGKTPVLQVGDAVVFESAVILEYLEDTTAPALHPADPLARARHRGWIEFASATLNDIGGLYSAPDAAAFQSRATTLGNRFRQLEAQLGHGPWFAGAAFSLVDAAFAPVFRYFDVFETLGDFGVLANLPKVAAWRAALANRPSVKAAVGDDYPARLLAFLRARQSQLGALAREQAVTA